MEENEQIEKASKTLEDEVLIKKEALNRLLKERIDFKQERDALEQDKKDFQQMLNHTIYLFGEVSSLMGGQFPTSVVGIISTANKVFKKVQRGEFNLENLNIHIEKLKELAPKHLTEEQIKIIDINPSKEVKK